MRGIGAEIHHNLLNLPARDDHGIGRSPILGDVMVDGKVARISLRLSLINGATVTGTFSTADCRLKVRIC